MIAKLYFFALNIFLSMAITSGVVRGGRTLYLQYRADYTAMHSVGCRLSSCDYRDAYRGALGFRNLKLSN